MTTAPRDREYLTQTLVSLDRAGASECHLKLIVSDGPMANPANRWRPGWDTLTLSRGGSRLTMWRAFQAALDAGIDRLIYCQDDIIACKNAVRRMLNTAVPQTAAFIDYFDMKESKKNTPPGLYPIPPLGCNGDGKWGSQCMAFEREALNYLVTRDPFSLTTARGAPIPQDLARRASAGSDAALGWAFDGSPWPTYALHVPSLVQHIGSVSSIASERFGNQGQSPTFPGSDFDAFSLPAYGLGGKIVCMGDWRLSDPVYLEKRSDNDTTQED